jgi:hypothetical protein
MAFRLDEVSIFGLADGALNNHARKQCERRASQDSHGIQPYPVGTLILAEG